MTVAALCPTVSTVIPAAAAAMNMNMNKKRSTLEEQNLVKTSKVAAPVKATVAPKALSLMKKMTSYLQASVCSA
jgi:uncharacterized oligopeptide transporter (OPT) family protein